jgi:hypothetical protein
MTVPVPGQGARYVTAFKDGNGNFLDGGSSYRMHLPPGIPAAIFWSATVYDAVTASGLDNGQPFPSLNTMDKPVVNADGSTDTYFGSEAPASGKNYLATVPNKGYFVILRLYGPTKAYYHRTWKPDDIVKAEQEWAPSITFSVESHAQQGSTPTLNRSGSQSCRHVRKYRLVVVILPSVFHG